MAACIVSTLFSHPSFIRYDSSLSTSKSVSMYLGYFLLPHFIIQSINYKTISTTYVVEPKILQYLFSTCLAQ